MEKLDPPCDGQILPKPLALSVKGVPMFAIFFRRKNTPRPQPRRAMRLHLEALEDRFVPSTAVAAVIDMSPAEQYMLEMINRGRANPTQEALNFGIDLNEGLAPGTISPAAKQPLAPNQALLNAIRGHLQDMLANNFFSHTGSDGRSPWDRIAAAGYSGFTLGENLAWQGTTGVPNLKQFVETMYKNLFVDSSVAGRGHRLNLLNDNFKEVGSGVASGPFQGFNSVLVGQDFGAHAGDSFLTGVVYNDLGATGVYAMGEEFSGANVTATNNDTGDVFTTTTGTSGGYSLQLPAGMYTVVISGDGPDFSFSTTTMLTLGAQNVKLDFGGAGPAGAPPAPLAADSLLISTGGVLPVSFSGAVHPDNSRLVALPLSGNQLQPATMPDTHLVDLVLSGHRDHSAAEVLAAQERGAPLHDGSLSL
jgi:uncharacterized protein YkwD